MIKLTRLNGEPIVVNSSQIMIIDSIPESKIVFMNKEYFIVRESTDEIIEKVAEFQKRSLLGLPMRTQRAADKSKNIEKQEDNGN